MAYRVIDDTKLTAVADAAREMLNTTVQMTDDEMPDMIRNIGIGVVPSYWSGYLAEKAIEIDSALEMAGDNRSAFLWYTDAHWTTNYGQSPMILKYLSKHTGMKKTFFGGDIANATSGEIEQLTAWRELVAGVPNHHSMIGNHDNQVTEFSTAEERADFFLMNNRSGDMAIGTDATNGKMYYYIDNHIEKTRYICMSTGRMWVYSDETQWCIDTLNSVPDGWHIVIVSHLWLNNDYANGGIITTPEDYTQFLLDVFDAYNYRESGTTAKHSLSYDFSNAGAKIEFIIGGHVHQDYDFATATGIPVILTECDAWQERDDVSAATQGTTTENCVYAIVADYDAKVVKVINVGRGDTRSVAIPDVVMYTNLLPTAIGFDGAVLNADTTPGYAPNSRYSTSSNKLSTLSGAYATGLIPCSPTSTIYLRNISIEQVSINHGIVVFDANDTDADGKWYKTVYTFTNLLVDWADNTKPVYDENGALIQVTLPGWQTTQTHFAICSQYIGSDTIITVDEPIA